MDEKFPIRQEKSDLKPFLDVLDIFYSFKAYILPTWYRRAIKAFSFNHLIKEPWTQDPYGGTALRVQQMWPEV